MATTWSLRQLFTKTAAAVRGGLDCPAEVIEAGDIIINTVERTAKLRGERLPLTPEEFDVLVFYDRTSSASGYATHHAHHQLVCGRIASHRVLEDSAIATEET